MTKPFSPPVARASGRRELPAYLSNGVIGLRVGDNPLAGGMSLLNGFTGIHAERKIEVAATAPYPLAGDIAIDGVWLSDVGHRLTRQVQSYDFETGELTSSFSFEIESVRVDVEVVTFCCRHLPALVAQETLLRVSIPCNLQLRAIINTPENGGQLVDVTTETPGGRNGDFDFSIRWESEGGLGRCGLGLVSVLKGDEADRVTVRKPGKGSIASEYAFKARAGKAYRLQQIAALVPSVTHTQPDRHAERLVALAKHQGFSQLRRANAAEWAELWKGRIILHGADRQWQQLADAAFFYLNASVHVSSPASTSMFGLATWHDYHYYYGHVMWDIESFALPCLSVTQPEAALALLDYRWRFLSGARSNAQTFGRRGLQFPWESAPSTGQECTPSPGTGAWHEDHISLDVALAFARYAHVTGDENFLIERAWPVLQGVADWILSRSHRSRRGYEIRRSMGIAERKKESDNDAFTNLSARTVLMEACRLAKRLGRTPGAQWQDAAGHFALPLRGDLLLPHDDYRSNEEKGATPGPLMALWPLGADLSAKIETATLTYFLKRYDEYIGSPMLSALYGVWAARLGDRPLSLHLLEEGYAKFITGRFLQTMEYRTDRFPDQPMAGPFFANMGGFLSSLLFGFPRLQIGPGAPDSWSTDNVILPKGWKEISVDRMWLKGRPARMRARQGRKTQITFL